MGQADYLGVIHQMRLANGTLWPVPITLPVDPAKGATVGQPLALRDVYGNLLGLLHIEEIYPAAEPGQGHFAGGRLEVIRTPPHYDFVPLRHTPAELRALFEKLGWSQVVTFPRLDATKPSHEECARSAADQAGAGLLIQPTVGVAKPGDVDHYTRIRCYKALVETVFQPDEAVLSLLPLGRSGCGLPEAILHAIISRNYGCSHVIAGSGDLVQGQLINLAGEIGLQIIPFQAGDEPAQRPARPAVAQILAESSPPKEKQGLTIWFTGLSGSGKSTVAHALVERLAEFGRNVAFLDGDEIRTHLSKGLGFSKEDRDTNINRVGYVAGLIAAQGGTTICSVVSPYRATRDKARAASKGNFVEIFCDTPIDVCETRDVKGFYAKARAAVAEGKGMSFTGVDDPYEAPLSAEVTLDTSKQDVADCVGVIVGKLKELGYLKG